LPSNAHEAANNEDNEKKLNVAHDQPPLSRRQAKANNEAAAS
jgi:hypothetical protein